ncbi:hypothetical protein PORY_000577 [Pneumocystis oryctolagi]|uniref:Uncharacterized protein n=1 Tax=Pneumocystis oryctolagi TaxID=42067 RepID=A0ACB7CJL3_9ASCO|nr:hypothetical protein PORY_000577 [Pneumocystis oryctolagi]
MQTLQATPSRRVLSELTPSRTNVLQLSFLKRRRTSASSAETSFQEKCISDKELKRLKESDADASYLNVESVLCDSINTSPLHIEHEKTADTKHSVLLENNCINTHANCILKNEKYNDEFEPPDSYFSYINKRMLFEPFFISKEQIKKYANILKLRLRLAYYKLQINQPHSEFSALPLSLIPKRAKKNSPTKILKTTALNTQLPSPISSQTREMTSSCFHGNGDLTNTLNHSKYNIELRSPPLSEERYCRNSFFPSEFTKDVSK